MSTQPDKATMVTYKLLASEMLDEKFQLHESWDENLGMLLATRNMSGDATAANGFTQWVARVRADLEAKKLTMARSRLKENRFTHQAKFLLNLERAMKQAAAANGEWSAEMQRVLGLIEQAWSSDR